MFPGNVEVGAIAEFRSGIADLGYILTVDLSIMIEISIFEIAGGNGLTVNRTGWRVEDICIALVQANDLITDKVADGMTSLGRAWYLRIREQRAADAQNGVLECRQVATNGEGPIAVDFLVPACGKFKTFIQDLTIVLELGVSTGKLKLNEEVRCML